ncbi:C40 family peptidase [Falsibacillus pallidus]|uniref:NlpC/P60 family protein n=1 Tax=Falsibacillus pallidus TaxID=493781 RepID=A0A370GQF5_9BACI|nr:C40 family peptidase [Falsibacillus pallidus]RDI45476.1 NlpC/P60 family protein [Falsibacillus pallidus]
MEIQYKWLTSVSAATVWTKQDSSREMDQGAITNPVQLDEWIGSMTYDSLLDLCEGNRVQTQLLFGEEVLVLDEKDGWAQVIAVDQPSSKDERGYPGWVPLAQLEKVVDWDVQDCSWAVVFSKKADLLNEEGEVELTLSFQTRLPVLEEENGKVKVKTPIGAGYLDTKDVAIYPSIKAIPIEDGEAIVKYGEQFLDLPYLWGGMSSYGYDCSGFSYNMCKANGVIIPRDAHDQAASGEKVELEDIQRGDLLFFAYEEGKGSLHHVGIYYGDGKLLHSPKTGRTIEILDMKGTIYEKELCAASRYWKGTGDAS